MFKFAPLLVAPFLIAGCAKDDPSKLDPQVCAMLVNAKVAADLAHVVDTNKKVKLPDGTIMTLGEIETTILAFCPVR